MKVAIVSTGLGHVQRGVEAWAADIAEALVRISIKYKVQRAADQKQNPVDVTLFCSGHVKLAGVNTVVLPCLRRGSFLNRILTGMLAHAGGWRYGFGSPYQAEQATFAGGLIRHLTQGHFDVVHLQDPWLAWLLERARQQGRHPAQVILAHGTEESMEFLRPFAWIQELSPLYAQRHGLRQGLFMIPNFVDTEVFKPKDTECLAQSTQSEEDWRTEDGRQKTEGGGTAEGGNPPRRVNLKLEKRKALDGLISCGASGLKSHPSFRTKLGIPEDAFVVGSVGAVQKSHKRMDYLIREFASALRGDPGPEERAEGGNPPRRVNLKLEGEDRRLETGDQSSVYSPQSTVQSPQPFLLIAGARTGESDELVKFAEDLVPGHVKFLFDLKRSEMPDVYRCMDLYVHPAEREIFGICLLEAMASGVPCLGHKNPVTEWIIKGKAEGGMCVDMGKDGELAEVLGGIVTSARWKVEGNGSGAACHAWLEEKARAARRRAEDLFSSEVVVPQIIRMYEQVIDARRREKYNV